MSDIKHKDLVDDILAGLLTGYKSGDHKWKLDTRWSKKYQKNFQLSMDLDDDGRSDGEFEIQINLDKDFSIKSISMNFKFNHMDEYIWIYGYENYGNSNHTARIKNEIVYELGLSLFENNIKSTLPTEQEEREMLMKVIRKVGRKQMRRRKIDDILDEYDSNAKEIEPTDINKLVQEQVKKELEKRDKNKGFFQRLFGG